MRLKHQPALASFMMAGIFLLGLFSQPAFSAVYKWKDDQGRTHITDDESKIPVQYRNKDKLKKLKGFTAKKTTPEEGEESEEGEEGLEEGEEGSENQEESAEGEEGGGELSEEDQETLAMLEEVKTFMVDENKVHNKLIEFVPADEKNGKNYILPLKKRSVKKKALVDKMYESKIRVLKPMVNFLRQSAALDSEGKLGGVDYAGRVLAVKNRIEREVLRKEKMIKILEEEITKLQ